MGTVTKGDNTSFVGAPTASTERTDVCPDDHSLASQQVLKQVSLQQRRGGSGGRGKPQRCQHRLSRRSCKSRKQIDDLTDGTCAMHLVYSFASHGIVHLMGVQRCVLDHALTRASGVWDRIVQLRVLST